jgi:RNA polymerase sigma factor (TIGR02999 family)
VNPAEIIGAGVLESGTPDPMDLPNPPAGDATGLLLECGQGGERARDQIVPVIYDELRRLAAAYMRRERSNHTLQPTALVHEAYLRLIDQRRVDWNNRSQFVGMAALMMRRVLANHARERAASKRDHRSAPLTLTSEGLGAAPVDALALHEALDRLAALDARKATIVELRFFGGLTTAEIASFLDISSATVERDWVFARAWLFDALARFDVPVPRRIGAAEND